VDNYLSKELKITDSRKKYREVNSLGKT